MNVLFLFLVLASLFLVSCCKNCFLSRDEISWTRTRDVNKLQITEIHDGDKYVEITSDYCGVLKKFTVDDIEVLIPQNNDMILKDINSGENVTILQQESYISNNKNTVCICSILENGLKLQKTYRMNLETGDLFILKNIKNEGAGCRLVSLIQTLTIRPGGYLIVPLSLISRYPARFIIYDDSGKIKDTSTLRNSIIANEKLVFSTKDEKITLYTDASDSWFGYILDNKMLLVKYSLPSYKRIENPVIFSAKISQNKIEFSFGETIKAITINEQLEVWERIILISLGDKIESIRDVENAMKFIKIPLILER